MDRTACDLESVSGTAFDSWNIGAVSVKRVRLYEDGTIDADIRRHGGDPASVIRLTGASVPAGAVVTGSESLRDIERGGHKRISLNGYTEAPMTVGRYAALLASGAFDGYVNIGAFNCAPASTASAAIHTVSLRTDTPYAVIESDGDCLTPGQVRQLETVAVQCRRRRESLHAQPKV